jgi:hypothetical protein
MLPTGLSSTAMKRSPCALLTIECHHWFPNESFFFHHSEVRTGQARGLFQSEMQAVLDAKNLTPNPFPRGKGNRI